jgi:glycosyltransferase involved in cell wall biosynthesis
MWTRPAPFSVVLCTFNGARFLDEQLQSLREQDGVAEIIASDDGSTDDTLAILRRHAAEDARIRIHQNRERLGVTRNFEQAIQLARSPWIALADQDDIWLPGKLARLRARWDGGACLVHHGSRKFRGFQVPRNFSHVMGGTGRKFSGSDWRRLLYRNTVVGHTTLFRADLAARLAPFPAEVPHDWWLGVGAALHGRVQFVDECLVHYRIHATNAYHAAGSRLRRLQTEHGQRRALLQALLRRLLPPDEAGFAREYESLLRHSSPGVFPWRLWHFYRWHAPLFFGGPHYEPSYFTAQRKSCGAAIAAMLQAPATAGERAHAVVPPDSVPLND